MNRIIIVIIAQFLTINVTSQEISSIVDSVSTSLTYSYPSESDSSLIRKEINYFDSYRNKVSTFIYNWNESNNVWEFHQKQEYSYDTYGYQLSLISYMWNSTNNDWIYFSKEESAFTSDGKWLLNAYYSWDETSNIWIGSNKFETAYDEYGNTTLNASYRWDKTRNDWKGEFFKFEYDYDANGNMTSYNISDWDRKTFNWKGWEKHEYLFSDNDDRIRTVNYLWDTQLYDWYMYSKVEYYYGLDNHLIYDSTFLWDTAANVWNIYSMVDYYYDSNGNRTSSLSTIWNNDKGAWENLNKHEYSYDVNGNLLTEIIQKWDTITDDWIFLKRLEHTFDANGYETLDASYLWSEEKNDWVGERKEVYAFDENGNKVLEEIYPSWNYTLNDWNGFMNMKSEWLYDDNGNKLFQIQYDWDADKREWFYSRKEEFAYDADGNRTLYALYSEWDSIDDIWLGQYKYTFFFDDYGRIQTYSVYMWTNSVKSWYIKDRSFYSYTNGEYLFTDSVSICEGDSVHWRNSYYKTSNIYKEEYQSILLKDSIYELKLSVLPRPQPFDITGLDSLINGQIEIYTIPENSDLLYTWFANSGEILSYPSPNTAEIQWTTLGEGFVYSFAVDSNQCVSDTAILKVDIVTSVVKEINPDIIIRIFPNPVSNILHISSTTECITEIYDINGKILLTTSSKEIDVSMFDSGTYLIALLKSSGEIIRLEKVIIE